MKATRLTVERQTYRREGISHSGMFKQKIIKRLGKLILSHTYRNLIKRFVERKDDCLGYTLCLNKLRTFTTKVFNFLLTTQDPQK